MTMHISCDDWTVLTTLGSLPITYTAYRDHARCADELDLDGSGHPWFIAVRSSGREWPEVVIAQRFRPGPEAGFHPGVLIASDTGTLFLGAGIRLLAYDLRECRRLWTDEAGTGFWGFRRHGDVVLMSAELELTAWTTTGRKLWTTFVEPPWSYDVDGATVHLDVMGAATQFALRTGPPPARRAT